MDCHHKKLKKKLKGYFIAVIGVSIVVFIPGEGHMIELSKLLIGGTLHAVGYDIFK